MNIIDDIERDLDHSSYERVRNEFVSFFKRKSYYLAAGQFGSVTYPGISDLDMFLCVETNCLSQASRDYLDWVEADKIRKYCFYHQPVMTTTQTLPYLNYTHTLYNFRILDKKDHLSFNLECKIEELLNIVWTTFLIKIVNRIMFHQAEVSARRNLLVLKNMHQSEINLGGRSKALDNSDVLRGESLKFDNSQEVLEEIIRTTDNIFSLLDRKFDNIQEKRTKISFNISREVQLIRSHKSYFKNGDIYIQEWLFDHFVKSLFWNEIPDEVEKYYNMLSDYSKIELQEGVSPSSVNPFGYPFYRSAILNFFKSSVRKFLL